MATWSKCEQGSCSTFRPDTTPGSLGTSPMFPCISSARPTTPVRSKLTLGVAASGERKTDNRETRVELAREELVAMRLEAVRQTRIPPDAGSAPLPRRFAPNPDCCFPAKDAPAPEIVRVRQTRPDQPEIRSPHGSTNGRCGSALAASPPTDTARLSACLNHDSIPAPGNRHRANGLSPVPACSPNP